jgi:TPR repeat protein
MYLNGCGVAQNQALAAQLYRRGCSYGSMLGCEMASRFAGDHEQALALLETPCARGWATACGSIGIALYERGREADVARAGQLLEAACCNTSASYCPYLAELVIQWKLTAKYHDVQEQLERACQAQENDACRLVASAYDQGLLGVTDPERAMAIDQFACHQNGLASCDAVGHRLVLGRGAAKDELAGVRSFYLMCAMFSYGPSCDSLGQAMEQGWGAPADPAQAVQYYQRGCTLGSEHACQRARELGAKK